jgi:hypothetical protein
MKVYYSYDRVRVTFVEAWFLQLPRYLLHVIYRHAGNIRYINGQAWFVFTPPAWKRAFHLCETYRPFCIWWSTTLFERGVAGV